MAIFASRVSIFIAVSVIGGYAEDCHEGGSLTWDHSLCNTVTCGGSQTDGCPACGPALPQNGHVGKCWYDSLSQQSPCSCCKKLWVNQTSCDDPCSPRPEWSIPGPPKDVCTTLPQCFWGGDDKGATRCCLARGDGQQDCKDPCHSLSTTDCKTKKVCSWDPTPSWNVCRCNTAGCGPSWPSRNSLVAHEIQI